MNVWVGHLGERRTVLIGAMLMSLSAILSSLANDMMLIICLQVDCSVSRPLDHSRLKKSEKACKLGPTGLDDEQRKTYLHDLTKACDIVDLPLVTLATCM